MYIFQGGDWSSRGAFGYRATEEPQIKVAHWHQKSAYFCGYVIRGSIRTKVVRRYFKYSPANMLGYIEQDQSTLLLLDGSLAWDFGIPYNQDPKNISHLSCETRKYISGDKEEFHRWWNSLEEATHKVAVSRVRNAEQLRILTERIGEENYLALVAGKMIAECLDGAGNRMRLYDANIAGMQVRLLQVICPSTGRVYYLIPPSMWTDDPIEAKASTFGLSKEEWTEAEMLQT